MGALQVDGPAPGTVTAGAPARVGSETAERQRSAVSLSVSAYTLAAAVCFVWATYSDGASLSWALLAFVLLLVEWVVYRTGRMP